MLSKYPIPIVLDYCLTNEDAYLSSYLLLNNSNPSNFSDTDKNRLKSILQDCKLVVTDCKFLSMIDLILGGGNSKFI
jgi:hypothetical protein